MSYGDLTTPLIGRALPGLLLPSGSSDVIDFAVRVHSTLVMSFCPSVDAGIGATQTLAFCDLAHEFERLQAKVLTVSSQALGEQRAFAQREAVAHELICDADMRCADALGLPTTVDAGRPSFEPLTLVVQDGVVEKAIYAALPPEHHAVYAVGWLYLSDSGRASSMRASHADVDPRLSW